MGMEGIIEKFDHRKKRVKIRLEFWVNIKGWIWVQIWLARNVWEQTKLKAESLGDDSGLVFKTKFSLPDIFPPHQ